MRKDPDIPALPRFSRDRLTTWAILILLGCGAFSLVWNYVHRPQKFIRHWSEQFQSINNFEEAKKLSQSEPIVMRSLPSGEWLIATCEHSCCTGAGFDATVIRDSTGAVYADTTHTFCGIEGLEGELSEKNIPAPTLAAFYSGLVQLKLQRQSR